MKKLLLISITFLLPYFSIARENPMFFMRPFSFVCGMPLGNFSAKGNSPLMPARSERGYGLEGSFTGGWSNGWSVGLGYQSITYRNDSVTTNKWVYDNYHRDGYYTKINNSHKGNTVSCISAIVSREFDLKWISVAPTVHIGVGIFGEVKDIEIHEKKINDNYWQDIHVFSSDPAGQGGRPFFYPRIGVSAAKRVYWFCYLRANVAYGLGTVNYTTTEMKNDFLGEYSRKDITYKHPISNLSASIGIEVKIRKRLSEEEKQKYNMK